MALLLLQANLLAADSSRETASLLGTCWAFSLSELYGGGGGLQHAHTWQQARQLQTVDAALHVCACHCHAAGCMPPSNPCWPVRHSLLAGSAVSDEEANCCSQQLVYQLQIIHHATGDRAVIANMKVLPSNSLFQASVSHLHLF